MFNKQLREDLDNVKQSIAITTYIDWHGQRVPWFPRTVKSAIESIESRLSEQEKLTRMILAHLGVEYAKTTEETRAGKQEKEVLRKIKQDKARSTDVSAYVPASPRRRLFNRKK